MHDGELAATERDAFIEVGEYSDSEGCYDEEGEVTEYYCETGTHHIYVEPSTEHLSVNRPSE